MSDPFRQKPVPAFQVAYSPDLSGQLNTAAGEYSDSPSVQGKRAVGNGNAMTVRAGRKLVKVGDGGMYAPRTSE